ncbi:MAG TPA: extracellular solute-binding protein [Stellaceae bacterium]|nr:extracellular solute-binding protein [Stellaceae bacterium]
MRRVLAIRTAILVLAAAMLVAAIGPARAQKKDVYFLSWGGTIQTMLEKEGWADTFAKDTGYKVTLVPKATSAEIIATAVAQKDKPQVDVVMCDLVAYLQGVEHDIFASLKQQEVPNLAKMLDLAKVRDKGIATYADLLGIVYNRDIFKREKWAPPKSWADIERPEFKGKLVIPPVSNTYGLYTLVELARLNGGSEKNIEPGFAALKKLAPNVVDWTTTFAKIGEMMESETVAIAVFGNSSGWEIAKRGVPADVVIPQPIYISPTVAGIMQNAPNPEGARVFLNWLISEKVLTYRAERFGQSPMNRDVKLSGEAAQRVPTGEALNGLAKIDYEYVLAHRDEWNARFEREIAPIR